MQYIELKINGTIVELPSDALSIELNYRIQDGLNVSGASSERSVELPYTKGNKSALGELGELKAMQLQAGGIPILTGKAQFNELALKAAGTGQIGKAAKVALYGSNADWITLLGDKKLSELDWSNEEHTLIDITVKNGFTNSYPLSNYVYHIWRLKDWTFFVSQYAATATDCSPALPVRTILDKMFNEIGYTYSGVFQDTLVFKNLILPVLLPAKYPQEFASEYLNGEWEKTTPQTYTRTANLVDFLGLDFDTHTAPAKAPDPFQDSVVSALTTNAGVYTTKIAGYYKFTYELQISNFVGFTNTQLSFALFNNLGGLLAGSQGILVADGDTLQGSFIAYFAVGIDIYTGFILAGGDMGAGDTFDIDFARVNVYSDTAEITYGAPIDFKYLLQDWTCRDFLKGLTHAFNLAFETDAANQNVLFEPKDDYLYRDPATFSTPAGALEIKTGFYTGTQDLLFDISKESFDKFEDIGNETVFSYKEDSNDETVQFIEENSDKRLYECRYSRINSKFSIKTQERENPFFAATMHLLDTQIEHEDSIVTPLLPLLTENVFITDPTNTNKVETYEPRLLYFAGVRSNIFINYYDVATASVIKLFAPEAFAVNYNDTSGTDFSLSFDNQIVSGNEVIGLMQRFYLIELARTRLSVKRKTYAYFKMLDILNLSFRPFVLYNDKRYLLMDVLGFNPLVADSTKVTLMLDEPQTAIDLSNIENSGFLGFLADEGGFVI